MRVLVVDDEIRLARTLRVGLEAEGFAVDVAHDGTDGLWLAREHPYDAIVLDLMLPGINGYKVCETLRAREELDPDPDAHRQGRRVGPGRGARHRRRRLPDQAVLLPGPGRPAAGAGPPRCARAAHPCCEAGDLVLDPAARRAWRGEAELDLTAREFSLLDFLVRHLGDVVSKRQILDAVWDVDFDGDPNIVEVYVAPPPQQDRPAVRARGDPDAARRGLPAGQRRWLTGLTSRARGGRSASVRVRTTLAAVVVVAVVAPGRRRCCWCCWCGGPCTTGSQTRRRGAGERAGRPGRRHRAAGGAGPRRGRRPRRRPRTRSGRSPTRPARVVRASQPLSDPAAHRRRRGRRQARRGRARLRGGHRGRRALHGRRGRLAGGGRRLDRGARPPAGDRAPAAPAARRRRHLDGGDPRPGPGGAHPARGRRGSPATGSTGACPSPAPATRSTGWP